MKELNTDNRRYLMKKAFVIILSIFIAFATACSNDVVNSESNNTESSSTEREKGESDKIESQPESDDITELPTFGVSYNAGYICEGDSIYTVVIDNSNNLMVLDIDNKKLIGKTDLSQYNEITANGTDYTKVMLIPDRSFFTDDIILCNLAYSDDGQYSIYGYLIFDKYAKFKEEILLKEERFYTFDSGYVAIEYMEEDGVLKPFLSLNDNTTGSKQFSLPDNYFPRNVKIQNVNIIASGYLGSTPAVMVADMKSENVQIKEYETLDNGRFEFFVSEQFALWRNISQKNTESYESGKNGTEVPVYDFSKKEFRTVRLEHLAEGRTCILSHDGTKILTYHSASDKCIIREYDIATGEKTSELISEKEFKNPVAVFGKSYVAITSETDSSKAEFLTYR